MEGCLRRLRAGCVMGREMSMEVMRAGDSVLFSGSCSLLLAVAGWRKIRRRAVQIIRVIWTDGVVVRILIVVIVSC